jgi:metal-dependent amidase/aminoacylase/carboxypeptidase family protein
MTENVIPDQALLRLNIRTFKDHVRQRVLAAVRRILEAEATASGAPRPPDFSVLSEYPVTINDDDATSDVVRAFEQRFGTGRVQQIEPAAASEDFGIFGTAFGVPSVMWFVGGVDEAIFTAAEQAGTVDTLPGNHAPNFAPAIHPTLRTGVEAMLTAAGVWLTGAPAKA